VFAFSFEIVKLFGGARWIYFKRGAEYLERHPGLSNIMNIGDPFHPKAKQIKFIFGIALIASIGAIVKLWIQNF
jgi:hypothetical protein